MPQFFDTYLRQANSESPDLDLTMRKLLRCRVTKAFLTETGGWTKTMGQALQLTKSSDARAATRNVTTAELEIYYSFDPNGPTQWDFALPLD